MAKYTVSIAGVRGAYNKVKSALAGIDHTYDKATKTFSFEADEAPAMPEGLTAVAEAADSEPESVAPPSLAAAPAPASGLWTVEVDIPRFNGASTIEVEGDQPDAELFARKFGGASAVVKDAKGKTVASWP
jgi:hypothetical protein